ncbi:DUF975 family protein [Enterococcus rivorum]|uniref:Molybdenum ABC transporter substrate-binding protein n=1 Tax=Enterococcus rivorum TaxID=762845 RepID=A0A1E5KZM2_9ENTE|nr:DUF975 family protein [Enterococcus rivorum]OEH83275.1 molybdenum ABC transporter substrate-binding protein [Enterococcus rivorum]
MMNRKALKQEAKETLKGRWKEAVLLNLIPTAIMIIASIILVSLFMLFFSLFDFNSYSSYSSMDHANNASSSGGGGLISGLLTALFTVGISWTFLDLLRNPGREIRPFKDATRGFRDAFLGPIIGLYLLQAVFIFFWTLLFIIPGFIKGYAYSQTYFIYYDTYATTGEKLRFTDCITASRQLMKGHKMQLFILDLSFIPWYLLGILTFGIGFLWITPYVNTTKAAFYNTLAEAETIEEN